jgi:hypothetical protein
MSEFDSGQALATLGKDFMRAYGLSSDSKVGPE